MTPKALRQGNVAFVASMFLLAFGSFSLRFHQDGFPGLCTGCAIGLLAILAWKKRRSDVS